MNQEEANQKILELINKDDLSEEEIKLFKELIYQCDLKIQNKYEYEYTPLMYALKYNNYQNLNLNEDQWDYLIKNSDLKQKNEYGYTPLMYALNYNKYQDLNLNEEQWDYLIKNSDLTQQNNRGDNLLMFALYCNKTQNLNLTKKQFKEIYETLNKEQKQKTFKQFIQTTIENNHDYIEEVNLLLYNLQFKPDKKTIYWLKKNNYQDIVQMIEKRDLFFQLNKNFKEIDKKEKITTIKL